MKISDLETHEQHVFGGLIRMMIRSDDEFNSFHSVVRHFMIAGFSLFSLQYACARLSAKKTRP